MRKENNAEARTVTTMTTKDEISRNEGEFRKLAPIYIEGTPHSKSLEIEFISYADGRAIFALPYEKSLVGNTSAGILHGGAITSLLDQLSGFVAIAAVGGNVSVATLNLNIDYLRAAKPGNKVLAVAHCFKTTHNIVFVRGVAHDGDESDAIAISQASFVAKENADGSGGYLNTLVERV